MQPLTRSKVLLRTLRTTAPAQLNDIRWRYNTHACTVEKDNGQTRGTATNRRRRSASATIRSVAASVKRDARSWADSQPASHHHPVCLGMTAYWGEAHGDVLFTYVDESGQDNYDLLARVDSVDASYIFWVHCQSNGTAQLITDI